PAAAAVGYTRKSLITDAVQVLAAGIDGLNLKPHGPSDEAIHQATAKAAPGLLEAWARAVDRSFNSYLQRLMVSLLKSGLGREASYLSDPDRLSTAAGAVLGPKNFAFLRASGDWWAYRGREPEL
ncbi:MAG: hypothetical protein V1742_08455, partial [Pseudomonadota bacterium]